MIKIKPILLCLLLTVFVSGCSFRFVYNHLDWWVNWYLDDYVTLSKQQQQEFDEQFEQLHLWHRKTQLPIYLQQLKQLKTSVNNDINAQQVADNLAQFLQHGQNLLIAAEPKLQPLVFSLSEKQKQQLLQALQENNQERLDDHEALTEHAWLEERADEQKKQLKTWFGKLSKVQKTQVSVMSQNFQRSFQPWIDYRQRWTSQFGHLLNGNFPEHQFKFEFYRLFVNGRSLRGDEYNAITQHNNQVFADIFVYMVATASEKQRKRLNKKINKTIKDLEYLIAND
ncbi:MAG: DUF6279 family lipoprotein [Cognaticolwellia sp.]